MDDLHRQLAEALRAIVNLDDGDNINLWRHETKFDNGRAALAAYENELAATQVPESASLGTVAGADSLQVESAPRAAYYPAFAASHVATDHCGFDRNESASEGHYVCTCGWKDIATHVGGDEVRGGAALGWLKQLLGGE